MTNIVSSLIQKDITSPSVAILQTPNSGVVLRNLKFPHSSPSRTHASKLQISCIYTRWFSSTPAALFVHRPRPLPPFPRSPESKKKSSLRLRPPSPNRPQPHQREREREERSIKEAAGRLGGTKEAAPRSRNQRNEGGVVALLAARRGQDDGAGGAAVRLARRGRYEGCGGEVKPLRSISSAIRLRT